jgi:23S rRNA (adenine2030-N6)-methyltransferase
LLSYRHSFHAGNFADIIKHIVLVEILESLCKKDKPFEYFDTHAGAGLFNLHSSHAQKREEHHTGISKLIAADWPELERYFRIIQAHNRSSKLHYYPGSPLIAADFLRQQDKAWLYELHPKDYELLEKNIHNRKVKTFHQDGLHGVLGLLPPTARRGVVLIDPSYEIKTEYKKVCTTVKQAYKKFSTGTYAIWYPVVDRRTIDDMENTFIRSGIKDIQRFELGLSPDTQEHGMTSSGMIVINPPWGLLDKMSVLLPKLANKLGEKDQAFYKCDTLVAE